MPRFLKESFAALGFPLVALAFAVAPCRAQTVIPPDTTPAADTTQPAQPGGVAPAPAAVLADSNARGPTPTVVARPPTDTVLAAGCAAGGSAAEYLLLVVFHPETEPRDMVALARSVGGTLAGSDAQGAYYLRVPPASRGGLSAVADRVILHDAVQSVGPAECPPAAPAPEATPPQAATPADTGAAP